MHHSNSTQAEALPASRQRWQEPAILVERSLMANAQGPAPLDFGPLGESTDP